MTKLEERIATAEQRLKQLKARKHKAEARKRSIQARTQRSQDLRKKILVGATVLGRVENGDLPESALRQWLDAALTRAEDRALFGLEAPKS